MTIYPRPTPRVLRTSLSTLLLLAACGDDGGVTTGSSSSGSSGSSSTADSDPTNPTAEPTTQSTVEPTSEPPTTTQTTLETSTTTVATTTDATTTDATTAGTTQGVDTTGSTGSTTDASSSTGDSSTGEPLTLCQRLGEPAGIGLLVTDFLGKVLNDDKINGYFLNSDVDGGALGACVVDQLGEAVGCPGVVYGCQDMKTAHAGLKISNVDFSDFAVDFSAALDDHQANNAPELTDDDKTAILGVLGGMLGDIVEDPTDDGTVYQRVGRKPAVQTLIGLPGEADSFVDNVANDAAINTFFAATDFERLRTCLTRQVSGIDGPTKYSLEVDAPPGIDPGVTLLTPCRDMVTAHAGLVDANATPIMYDDFVSLVTDLVTAMDTAGVTPEDKAAILGVLGPMCSDIVGPPAEKNKCPGNSESEVLSALAVNKAIPDDAYNGTIASMVCQDFMVADNGLNFVTGVKVKLGVNHTWIGDLVIKMVAPNAEVLTLLSRPAYNEPADDGTGCCGDSSDLAQASPISFFDAAVNNAEAMGVGTVVCKDDMQCDFYPNPGKGPGTKFSQYTGDDAIGKWSVCIADATGAFTGTLQDVTLTLDQGKFKP